MAWIKRNLFFIIGAVAAVALLGFAGFYNFKGWKHNADAREELNKAYEEIKRLNNQPIHPGFGKVDNIKLAREQQKEIRDVFAGAARNFQSPAAIPDTTNVTSGEFTAALRRTVDQLTREAARASVLLPPDFKFSFSQQFRLLNFAPGSLKPLAVQLGEVKALCDVLIKARVNHLDGIQRERISTDDLTGPQTEYVEFHSQTNELAVLTPYQITFRSFSPELAQVLAGLANSPNAFVVKGLNVEPAAATVAESPLDAPVAPVVPIYRAAPVPTLAGPDSDMSRRYDRYGIGGKMPTMPAATPQYYVAPAPAAKAALLSERQLRVTLQVELVKLLPKK
ncbi:MAG: Amuc_1100 family pilus-like protein [Verrucomicrobia bacterium]|jgi:hypothetical protein|nr:Amuc_1100 family pilus-like protein [Verrucomicrobiota bacterium]